MDYTITETEVTGLLLAIQLNATTLGNQKLSDMFSDLLYWEKGLADTLKTIARVQGMVARVEEVIADDARTAGQRLGELTKLTGMLLAEVTAYQRRNERTPSAIAEEMKERAT